MHGELHKSSATAKMRKFEHSSQILKPFKQWLKVYVAPYLSRIAQPFKEWFKARVAPYLPGGWRTAALVNTILMVIVSALMITLSAVALAQAGGFNKPLVLFTGACGVNGASTLNVTLHIIINIVSTAILASSNMFMQVLNAPSREEVDKSHMRGSWLEIGVLSWRNIFRLSSFKTVAWLGFFISSIPVHLLFNSSVFQASYRFSHYDLAIVSEPFLHGGKYFTPGASLLNSGGLAIFEDKRSNSDWSPDDWTGYGDFVNLTEYRNNASDINEKIAFTAQNGHSWKRLEKRDCKREYLTCSGLSAHEDVILVVSDTQGWPRWQVWKLDEEKSSFWDDFFPNESPETVSNSLWFYGKCAMSAYSGDGLNKCQNSCRWALGGSNVTKDWVVPFYPIHSNGACSLGSNASLDWHDPTLDSPGLNWKFRRCFVMHLAEDGKYADWNDSSIFSPEQNDLNIEYCLARPVKESCKVALSTTLLVCVTGCAILKTVLCALVYFHLRRQNPLVTPGDAINSFISEPDHHTVGMSLLSQGEVRMSLLCGAPQPGPRKYRQRGRKLFVSVPSSEWGLLLAIMIAALAGAVVLTVIAGLGAGGM